MRTMGWQEHGVELGQGSDAVARHGVMASIESREKTAYNVENRMLELGCVVRSEHLQEVLLSSHEPCGHAGNELGRARA